MLTICPLYGTSQIHLRFYVNNSLSSDNICTDNSDADEQRKHPESQLQSSTPAMGMSHPSITTPNVQYATHQVGAGHAMVLYLQHLSLFLLGEWVFWGRQPSLQPFQQSIGTYCVILFYLCLVSY